MTHHHGTASPLGSTILPNGVNFSLYSRHATGVELMLFDGPDDVAPARVISLDPHLNRTYHYWHVFVPNLGSGQIYAYRVHGPRQPERGMRFDAGKMLIDPYARGMAMPSAYHTRHDATPINRDANPIKSVVVDPSAYDWEGDQPLRNPSSRTIVYEMHVRGFTRNPNSGVTADKRGTFAGLMEKIPYLKDLGITAVELLPVQAYDPQACPLGLVNYWGYQPLSYFALHPLYSASRDATAAVDEFRDMVKALHRAGIEVILDVVYNHTAECGADGPTLCYRGIDNPTYYILEDGGARYADYSGCGNTLNANHPVVRRMIVDSLRYWVTEMHVDGFRFDLASILSRDSSGNPIPNPPVLWDIESDPQLAGTKLMAEAWDAAGLYQVGSFIGDAWKEWNGRFRDDARSFFRGEPGSLRRFADRLVGSPELYGHKQREPEQSVNFVTCHDGFTLNDLVSYERKHNFLNGEQDRDGSNDNFSWNCGVEGDTDDPAIERLRNRQVRNFLTVTMLALGVPMILMGDEVRRSQNGNNNLYCHDNETNWFDWSLLKKHADLHRFTRILTQRRSFRSIEHEKQRLTLNQIIAQAEKAWHGTQLNAPDWGDDSRSIALGVFQKKTGMRFHLILNAYWDALTFDLPGPAHGAAGAWRRWIDTALDSPNDIVTMEDAPALKPGGYRAEARSVVLLYMEGEATS